MGILSSGCFFAETLGPTLYQMRSFLQLLGKKLPVRSSVIICNFAHRLGFSKFSFYKFENVMGIQTNYMYRLRHLHKLFSTVRRLVNYTPIRLCPSLCRGISPFGHNTNVSGYGRCLVLHRRTSSNNAAQHNYCKYVYKYRYRHYCRHINTRFFYFFMNRRDFIDYEEFSVLDGVMLSKTQTAARY